jgi:hypothetical protein
MTIATIIIGAIALVVGAALLMRFTAIIMGRAVGGVANERHREAEHIVENGSPPPAWLKAISKGKGATVGENGRQRLLKKVDDLARYFSASPAFEDDEARRMLLTELRKARDAWSVAGLDDLMRGGTPLG